MKRENFTNTTERRRGLNFCRLDVVRWAFTSGLFAVAVCGAHANCDCGVRTQQNESQGSSAESTSNQLSYAKALLESGRVAEAEEKVREYVKAHNSSAEGHFLLGTILFRKIQAEAAQSRAVPAGSDVVLRPDEQSFREDNARASLAEFTEGAKYAKPSATDLKVVAMDYVLLGSYADASKWLARALEWNPGDGEAWYYLGRSKYNENRFAEAIEAFSKCLALEPRNVKAKSNLGLAYAGLNRVEEAVAAFHAAIAWQADSPRKIAEPYIGLGDLLLQQNRAEEAAANLEEAVRIDPRESRAREKLASAYLALKRPAEARSELEAAVEMDPKSASLHYLLASSYRQLGLADKAAEELRKFEELKAQDKARHPESAQGEKKDH